MTRRRATTWKLEMDAIFGKDACRNEITWTRTNTHNDSRHSFPNVADVILFYAHAAC